MTARLMGRAPRLPPVIRIVNCAMLFARNRETSPPSPGQPVTTPSSEARGRFLYGHARRA